MIMVSLFDKEKECHDLTLISQLALTIKSNAQKVSRNPWQLVPKVGPLPKPNPETPIIWDEFI